MGQWKPGTTRYTTWQGDITTINSLGAGEGAGAEEDITGNLYDMLEIPEGMKEERKKHL